VYRVIWNKFISDYKSECFEEDSNDCKYFMFQWLSWNYNTRYFYGWQETANEIDFILEMNERKYLLMNPIKRYKQ
jgi:hypothetical protein